VLAGGLLMRLVLLVRHYDCITLQDLQLSIVFTKRSFENDMKSELISRVSQVSVRKASSVAESQLRQKVARWTSYSSQVRVYAE